MFPQVEKLSGAYYAVLGLRRDRSKEELQPLLQFTMLAYCL